MSLIFNTLPRFVIAFLPRVRVRDYVSVISTMQLYVEIKMNTSENIIEKNKKTTPPCFVSAAREPGPALLLSASNRTGQDFQQGVATRQVSEDLPTP